MTVSGVGLTLAVVIALEVCDVARFATAEKLAGYAGTTPRVHASGGKTRFGWSRPDVNRYLKWAFVEAANAICVTRRRSPSRHVSRLYERITRRKGHPKAIEGPAKVRLALGRSHLQNEILSLAIAELGQTVTQRYEEQGLAQGGRTEPGET